jgi:DNA polymerase III alpha subunit
VTVGGIITTVRKITTKNGDAMAFVGLTDKTGETELIVFPKVYAANAELWQPDQLVKIAGKINTKDREGKTTAEIKIMVDKARALTDKDAAIEYDAAAAAPEPESEAVVTANDTHTALTIKLGSLADPALLNRIKELLSNYAGEAETFIVVGDEESKTIRLPFKVNLDQKLLGQLKSLLGGEAVAVA